MRLRILERGKLGRSMALCAALSAASFACGPSSAKPATQLWSEGGNDENREYGKTPPLGIPPTIDATAPAADFLIEVAGSIQPAWRSFLEDCRIRLAPSHALNDAKLFARLALTIDGQGKVLGVDILESSGNLQFDEVAVEILNDISQLPAPPPEWISDDNRVIVGWKFARDIRQAGSAGGSIQRVILPIEEALKTLLARGDIAAAAQRILDAGGRSIPASQVEAVLHRSLALAMEEGEPSVKVMALHVVAAAKVEALAEEVRALLGSTDKEVARAATLAIGAVGDTSDIQTLEQIALGTGGASPELRAAAAASLDSLGQGAQVSMAAAATLTSTDPSIRLAGLAVLSRVALQSDEAIRELAAILNDSKKSNRDERSLAADALGRQASQYVSATKALIAGLGSSDAIVRTSCVEAIGEAAKAGMRSRVAYWKVLELARNKDERVRAAVIKTLALLDPARFAGELKNIRAGGSNLVVMSMAAVLGEIPGAVALSRLLDLAALPSVAMRAAAATGLAKHKGDESEVALRALLADTAPSVRLAAIGALDTENQLELYLQDESNEVQAAALSALRELLGKGKTAKAAASLVAGSGTDRAQQVLWAKAWLVPGR